MRPPAVDCSLGLVSVGTAVTRYLVAHIGLSRIFFAAIFAAQTRVNECPRKTGTLLTSDAPPELSNGKEGGERAGGAGGWLAALRPSLAKVSACLR